MRTDPRATYRVQLREEFDFDAAAAIVPYLEAAGGLAPLLLTLHAGGGAQPARI